MLLQGKLDALSEELALEIAPAAMSLMDRTTEDLTASRKAELALKAGDQAPMFVLKDTDGKSVSSLDLLKQGPVVVSFYRGVWCPFCNLDLQALQDMAPSITVRGASLIAISQQTPANNRKSQQINDLNFPILADVGGDLAMAFGIRWPLPAALRDVYTALGADLPAFNGEASWTLPMPARYVIGQDGVIAFSEVNPDYTRRPEPRELLPVLDRLRTAFYV